MSGLLYVSARPFAVHAQSSAVSAIKYLVTAKQGKLRLYDALQLESPAPLSRLALAFVDDLTTFKSKATGVLQALPQVPRDVITNGAAVRADFAQAIKARKVAEKKELESAPGPFLPSELQPVLQESGLPQPPDVPVHLKPVLQDDGLPDGDPNDALIDDDLDDNDSHDNDDYDPDQDQRIYAKRLLECGVQAGTNQVLRFICFTCMSHAHSTIIISMSIFGLILRNF